MRATASDLMSQKREISSALLDLAFDRINLSYFIPAKLHLLTKNGLLPLLVRDLLNWCILISLCSKSHSHGTVCHPLSNSADTAKSVQTDLYQIKYPRGLQRNPHTKKT